MTTTCETLTLTIDGKTVSACEGETILQVARRNDIYIPTLCYHPDVEQYGACRLCLVEIAGMRGLNTACTVKVSESMVVQTLSPQIESARRVALDLLLADHPLECLTCAQNQRCELQQVAAYMGVDDIRYPPTR